MYRWFIKILAVSALFLTFLPGTTFAASIHSTKGVSPTKSYVRLPADKIAGKGIKGCKIQVLHLHGTQPPTMTCGDQPQTKHIGNLNPMCAGICQGSNNCNNATVSIWWDNDEQGPELCLEGNGYVSFTYGAYCAWIGIWCYNWNNSASSYELQGCALSSRTNEGDFETFPNGSEVDQPFNIPVSLSPGNFTGTNGRLPNDSLERIDLYC